MYTNVCDIVEIAKEFVLVNGEGIFLLVMVYMIEHGFCLWVHSCPYISYLMIRESSV